MPRLRLHRWDEAPGLSDERRRYGAADRGHGLCVDALSAASTPSLLPSRTVALFGFGWPSNAACCEQLFVWARVELFQLLESL